MSKRLITGLLVAALSLLAFGCDEDNNNKQNRPDKPKTGDECTVDTWTNTCKSADTRRICDGSKVVEEKCAEGYKCQKGECVEKPQPTVTCTNENDKPTCSKDGNYVLKCVDGIQQQEECEFGCQQGVCKTACDFTDKQCNAKNTAVTECQGGKVVEVEECPCDMGKCKETCSDKGNAKCSGSSLVYCTPGGYENVIPCDNGCDETKNDCKARCKEGCFGDTLVICDGNKVASETPCEFGCKNSKCLETAEEPVDPPGGGDGTVSTMSCESDPLRCTLSGTGDVIDCTSGEAKIIECEFGCSKGVCNDASSAPDCTGNGEYCDTFGEVLYHCNNGKQGKENCPFGCSNGKCNDEAHARVCIEGAAECAPGGSMLKKCQNNELVYEPCVYGCEEGKCVEKSQEKEPCLMDTCTYIPTPGVRKCVNGFYEIQPCDNGICVYDAYGEGLVACVPTDYCTEDAGCKHLGKNKCDTQKNKCE
jgi:hypothetical protein